MRHTVQNSKEGRFVVGVDFGTTFTSVAFAHSVSPKEVKLVQSWPNGPNGSGSADQVPTELRYTNSATRSYLWGYEIPNSRRDTAVETLKWFKLLLQRNSKALDIGGDGGQATPAFAALLQLHNFGMQGVQVVEDFLAGVRKTVLNDIGNTYDTQFVKNSKVEYVITIPAIWSDAAKAQMVEAAENAGYGRHHVDFHLVSEPEAAAAYTLKVIEPHEFKQNDTFIICDAGGGTVDLIAYKVKALQPLRIDEVVSGTGDLCGSVYLDDGFRAYMERRIGPELLGIMSPRSRTAMQKSWEEQVKFKFGTPAQNRNTDFEVVVPGIADDETLDIHEAFHLMASGNVQNIFDPIINKVVRLVGDQVKAVESAGHNVAALLLVGGFGCSPYLLHCLQTAKFGAKLDNIQVIQPVNARTAIARGALLRGLDGSIVTEKRARRSYGIQYNVNEIATHDNHELHRYWDGIDRCWRVRGALGWSIKKDSVLTNRSAVEIGFAQNVKISETPALNFSYKILASDQDVPPQWTWHPKTVFYAVCTLDADLSCIPVSQFKQVISEEGVHYYNVFFNIRATMVDDVLKFELVHNGKSYGEVTTKFE